MIANEEEEEKVEASNVGSRTNRSKRRIENIETDNILDLDKAEAQIINKDEVSSFNSEVYYRSGMMGSSEISFDENYDSEDENFSQGNKFEEWTRLHTARYYEYKKIWD